MCTLVLIGFRSNGSLLGFFLGSTLAGAGVYTYLVKEYQVSNELLTEDIYVRLSCPLTNTFLYLHTLYSALSYLY